MFRPLALLLLGASAVCAAQGYRSDFAPNPKNLGVEGANPYFILTPGYRLHFVEGATRDTWTVLRETVVIDGVECRVIEDREEKNGKPVEITRDYYAIDRSNGDVYYFGEDVDEYKNGQVVGHGGSWRSGVDGAKYGLMMPGKIAVGDRFMQERAPQQKAMDRSEVVATGEKIATPAGEFTCVHMKDSSPIEKAVDHKWYAPGVGLVKDGKAILVKIDK